MFWTRIPKVVEEVDQDISGGEGGKNKPCNVGKLGQKSRS
jgi:hypothetical protein